MHHVSGLVVDIHCVAGHDLPVIKYHLRECLAVCCTAEILVEAKGLVDGEISLECFHGSSLSLFLVDDNAAFLGQNGIDCTDSIFVDLNINQVERFNNCRFRV